MSLPLTRFDELRPLLHGEALAVNRQSMADNGAATKTSSGLRTTRISTAVVREDREEKLQPSDKRIAVFFRNILGLDCFYANYFNDL